MSFTIGETIGPYRILEQLGQGGMATVYKAYHASLDRYVALKVLHPAFMEDPNFLARFQREARVVAKLEHANIVPIYDYNEHEGRPYLVMKYIEGETLKARMARGPLAVDELERVIESVGAGLAFAHKRGVLHRDIKPSNVLLTTDGEIYLADFGLARIAQSGESTLTSDVVLGTPQYISPEQAVGKKELDEGTDIYSFGVILYELTVGKVPFSADTPFSVIHDHIYSPLPLPSAVNPSIPFSLERVLLKALAKERSDRYADVPALVAAFKEAWREGAISIDPHTVQIPVGDEQTTLPPQPAPAMPATAATPTESRPNLPPPPSDTVTAVKPAPFWKKRWFLIPVIFILCLCCLATALMIRDASSLPPYERLSLEQLATEAENNPRDPYAWFNLAQAQFEDKPLLAPETYRKAMDIAGNDEGFYSDVINTLTEEERWGPLAMVYVRYAEIADESLSEEQKFASYEALYKAAGQESARTYLVPLEQIDRISPEIRQLVDARMTLNRQPRRAQELLDALLAEHPDMPEAGLLRAELQFVNGESSQAQATLLELLSRPELPAWIETMAGEYLGGSFIPSEIATLAGPDSDVPQVPPTFSPRENGNLLFGSAKAEKSQSGHPAEMAIDGNAETYWTAGDASLPHTITIDLGGEYDIARIVLNISTNGSSQGLVVIHTAGADGKFREMGTLDTLFEESRRIPFEKPMRGVQFIRIEIVKASEPIGWREIEIFGK